MIKRIKSENTVRKRKISYRNSSLVVTIVKLRRCHGVMVSLTLAIFKNSWDK